MTENSNADMASLVTIGDVADFISMDGTDAHTETYRGAFFKKLGLTGAMKVGVIGLIKQPDFEAVIDSVKVMVPAPTPETHRQRGTLGWLSWGLVEVQSLVRLGSTPFGTA
jgi:translation elongation factor EF-4